MFGRRSTPATTPVEETRRLWDRLRDQAISQQDRAEIDAIFARQMR